MLVLSQVLSVVGQQVMTIQQALKGDNPRISFMGSDIIVKPGFGVFITMNPGYAGRCQCHSHVEPVSTFRSSKGLLGENESRNKCVLSIRPVSQDCEAWLQLKGREG